MPSMSKSGGSLNMLHFKFLAKRGSLSNVEEKNPKRWVVKVGIVVGRHYGRR